MTIHTTLTRPDLMHEGDLITVDGKPTLIVTARNHDGIQLHLTCEPLAAVEHSGDPAT